MALNVYEGLFIFESDVYARDMDAVSSQVTSTVEQLGGEVLISRLWDERKLAYPIKGQHRGTYWLSYFRVDPSAVKDLSRQFQLNETILRFLIVSVDARLVDTLVEHAKAGHKHAGAHAEIADEGTVSAVESAFEEEDEV